MGVRVSMMVVISLSVGLQSIVGNIFAASLRERVASSDVNIVDMGGAFCLVCLASYLESYKE